MTIDTRVPRRGVFLFAVLLLVLATVAGCSRHPKVSSRDSLDFIKQVYTACNTRNATRLTACKERLAELESAGKVSIEEADAFKRILEIASGGDWESAQTKAMQFAQDQVR